jgi:hypothetical protein
MGFCSSPFLQVIHDASLANVSTNEIQLLWCLIALESDGMSFQPTASDRNLSVLRRRGRAYDIMQKMVSEGNAHADDFLFTMGFAAAIEKRVGNVKNSQYHTRALKTIRKMNTAAALMITNMLIEIGIPGLYSYHGLLTNLEELHRKIQRLQDWNCDLRASQASKEYFSDTNGPKSAQALRTMAKHLNLWTRAFNDSALSQYIELPAGELTRGEYRFYLAMLFFPNVAFWAFRDSEEISKLYVKDLSSAAKMSKSTNFILQCFAAKLPSIMLLIMLAHYDVDSIGRDLSTSAVFAVEEVLDFVELMMMAKPKSRDTVLRALWSWLTSSNTKDLTLLSALQLDTLVDEIESEWLDNQTAIT